MKVDNSLKIKKLDSLLELNNQISNCLTIRKNVHVTKFKSKISKLCNICLVNGILFLNQHRK